jgi:hypothetical protein
MCLSLHVNWDESKRDVSPILSHGPKNLIQCVLVLFKFDLSVASVTSLLPWTFGFFSLPCSSHLFLRRPTGVADIAKARGTRPLKSTGKLNHPDKHHLKVGCFRVRSHPCMLVFLAQIRFDCASVIRWEVRGGIAAMSGVFRKVFRKSKVQSQATAQGHKGGSMQGHRGGGAQGPSTRAQGEAATQGPSTPDFTCRRFFFLWPTCRRS